MQEWLVALAVAGAVWYLWRRWKRSRRASAGCAGCARVSHPAGEPRGGGREA
jgi:hypothetical protein